MRHVEIVSCTFGKEETCRDSKRELNAGVAVCF